MYTIIGVRFKQAGKIYYFSPGQLEIELGQRVVVETARGVECGLTVIGPREVSEEEVTQPLKVVQRVANEQDLQRVADNKQREKDAFGICEKKIREHGLPMKLVDVEYTFDLNKIIFYFTADGRIDFRDLVKDLASVFRTRIELRQIGVRDEAKLMGGIGCCGRPLCCATFLGDFEPVSIRMAKEQNLSLNPTKISGICGRLMCCLKYESDCYCGQCHKKTPKVQPPQQGGRVVTVDGEGKVISLNQQRRTATILLDNSRTIVAAWEDVIEKDEDCGEEAKPAAAERTEQQGEHRSERRAPRSRGEHGDRERMPRRSRSSRNGQPRDTRESKDGQGEAPSRRRRPRRPRDTSKESGAGQERQTRSREKRRPRAPRAPRENGGQPEQQS